MAAVIGGAESWYEVADTIIDAKAEYLISVKKNQKKLFETIECWFSDIDIYGNNIDGRCHIYRRQDKGTA